MDPRQRRLMELARSGQHRVDEGPEGDAWSLGHAAIRSCGDAITIYVELREDRIGDVRYNGVGCILSLASAETVARTVSGLQREEARELLQKTYSYLSNEPSQRETASTDAEPLREEFEDLSVVREFPARKGCVLLALEAALSVLNRGSS